MYCIYFVLVLENILIRNFIKVENGLSIVYSSVAETVRSIPSCGEFEC